jgi:hypothetical protein
LKSEADKAYERFKERKNLRQKAYISGLLLVIIIVLIGFFCYYYVKWFYVYWVGVGLFSIFGFVMYAISREWAYENYEAYIYVYVHEASEMLGLVPARARASNDKKSLRYIKKAAKKLEKAILEMRRLVVSLKAINSRLVNNQIEPLETLGNMLEKRILPAISTQKKTESMIAIQQDMIVVLNRLAGVFQ